MDGGIATAESSLLYAWSIEGDTFVFEDQLRPGFTVWDIEAVGKYVVVRGRDGGGTTEEFVIVDFSKLDQIREVRRFTTNTELCDVEYRMTVIGDRIFLACRAGIGAIEFSNPAQAAWQGIVMPYDLGGVSTLGALLAGNEQYGALAYQGEFTGEMGEWGPVANRRLYGVEFSPLKLRNFVEFTSAPIYDLSMDGGYVFARRWDSYLVFDLTAPDPALLATVAYERFERSPPHTLAVERDQLFANVEHGLEIHDVHDPQNPQFECFLSSEELDQHVAEARVFGSDLYLVGERDRGRLPPIRVVPLGSNAAETCDNL